MFLRKKFDSMKGKTNINWQNLIGEKEGETYIKKKYELEGRYKSGMMKSGTESIEDCKVDKVRGKVTYIFQKGLHETIDKMQENIKELNQIIKDNKSKLLLVNIPIRDKDCRGEYIENTKYIFEKLNKSVFNICL